MQNYSFSPTFCRNSTFTAIKPTFSAIFLQKKVMDSTQIKITVTSAAAIVAAFVEPVIPVATLCTALVITDVVSAVRLRRRLVRKGKTTGDARLSSRRFGHAVLTVARIYAVLAVAHGADLALGDTLAFITGGHSALNMAGVLIFIWQLMSVLENESTCSDAKWAAKARKYLADKTDRYLNEK